MVSASSRWLPIFLACCTSATFLPEKVEELTIDLLKTEYTGCMAIVVSEGPGNNENAETPRPNLKAKLKQIKVNPPSLSETLLNHDIETINVFVSQNPGILLNVTIKLPQQKSCFVFVVLGLTKSIIEDIAHLEGRDRYLPNYKFLFLIESSKYKASILPFLQDAVIFQYSEKSEVVLAVTVHYERIKARQIIQEKDRYTKIRRGLPDYRSNHLIVSTLQYAPFFYFDDKQGEYDGLDLRIVKVMAEKMDFTYSLDFPEDGEWGRELPNGSWTGLVGRVESRKSNISISGVGMHPHRMKVTDMSMGVYLDGSTLASPVPKLLPKYSAIILPFSWLIWVLVVTSLLVSVLILFIILNIEKRIFSEQKDLSSFSKSFIICLKAICNETSYWLPHRDASRVAYATWSIISMVILYVYSGLLVSFLAKSLREKPIQSVNDIISQDKLGWGRPNWGGQTELNFMISEVPDIKVLWAQMTFPKSEKLCMEQAAQGSFVCISEISGISLRTNAINRRPGGPYVILSRDLIFSWPTSLFFQKGSTLKEPADKIILSLKEAGILQQMTKEFEGDAGFSNLNEADTQVLSLEHVSSAFYFLLMGYGFATLVFLFNFTKHRFSSRNSL